MGKVCAHCQLESRRVVVTGMGAVTPLGLSVKRFWEGLVEGRSGINLVPDGLFDVSELPTKIAALISKFDARDFMESKAAKRMSRFSQFAVAAAQEAVEDARLSLDKKREDAGVLLGCAIGGLEETSEAVHTMIEKGAMYVSPFFIVMVPANMASFHVAKTFGLMGYNNTCTTACAAGTQAIGEAAEVIRRGDAQVMIAGGTEGFSELFLPAFCAGRAFSTRNDEPEKASRPFDADRDGFVGGEGAGILVLESLSHALRRGARIYAEVLGYGASNDAYHLIAPHPEAKGAALAMRSALKNAGVDPSHVDYVNAHGTGTPLGDVAETLAIKKALGEKRAYEIVVNSTKSMVGHLWGAAGAVEAIATIKAIQMGVVHPTANLETPDPDCDLDYVPLKPREVRVNIAMSNSFGLGGQNASIVLAQYAGEI